MHPLDTFLEFELLQNCSHVLKYDYVTQLIFAENVYFVTHG